ncbi:NAD(P)/FAD-dependent oxidoreductase [Alsobacter sp. KACC 23698]|uniref:NAD(P)/FAD-dependent oxidoreductase n=1 Tax=Alsobacter sp. KACC 23698 TaxID=3149229 RepID=A0AAU7JG76_9HYPH
MIENLLKPDLCVIGGDPAGSSAALLAAALGASVILVEPSRPAGLSPDEGRLARLALRAAAQAADLRRSSGPFGVAASRPRIDLARALSHVRAVVEASAADRSPARLAALGVRVIEAEPFFVGPRLLRAGEAVIQARRYVVAAGSAPALPAIAGLEGTPLINPDSVLDLDAAPGRLIVLGGGTAALECAQAFRLLGADVTVAAPGPLLEGFDAELAAQLATALRRDGVDVRASVLVSRVAPREGGVEVTLEGGETLSGARLMVAGARRASVDGLALEAAGVLTDASGVVVDARMRTANRRIYAIGGCVGGPQGVSADRSPAHPGLQAAQAVQNALLWRNAKVDAALVPSVVATAPELACVGLSESEARMRHKAIRVLRWPYSQNDRARAERLTTGEIKVITTGSGVILGAAIIGAGAAEQIATWTLAVKKGLNVAEFRDLAFPHPTYAEASRQAALSFYTPLAAGRGLRRILAFLRLFG